MSVSIGRKTAGWLGSMPRTRGPARAAEIVEAFLAMRLASGERQARRIRLISDFGVTGDAPLICAG
jgi:hypothetical protein